MKPVVINVYGDKHKKLEPEHHRINFPGGIISVDRTTDGNYWAHISIVPDDSPITKNGKVIGSRVDFNVEEWRRRLNEGLPPIPDIDGMENAEHFAVCIKPQY